LPIRNAAPEQAAYADHGLAGNSSPVTAGGARVQTAHPRDVAALALVVGLFLVLFIVAVMLGSPIR
jgi:hypothetical protein